MKVYKLINHLQQFEGDFDANEALAIIPIKKEEDADKYEIHLDQN